MSSRPRSAVDQVADVVFYGPLGLVLDGRKLMPELAKRGRRQIAFTRTIGKYAVRRGRARLDDVVGGLFEVLPLPDQAGGAPTEATPSGNGSHSVPGVVEALGPDERSAPPAPASPGVDEIIDSYDSLSAVQVLPRLEGLSPDDLAAVRDHEAATRARRTILAKIAQLLP